MLFPRSEMRAQANAIWIADEFERLYRLSLWTKWIRRFRGATPRRPVAGTQGGLVRLKSRAVATADRRVTGRLVSDVLQALASLVMVPSRQIPAQPAWLPAWPVGLSAPEGLTRGRMSRPGRPTRSCRRRMPWCICRRSWRGIAHSTPPIAVFFNAYALEYDFDPGGPASPRVAELPRADLGARHRKHRGASGMVRLPADPRYEAAKDLDDGRAQAFGTRNDRSGA